MTSQATVGASSGAADNHDSGRQADTHQTPDQKLDKIMQMMGKVAVKDDIEQMRKSLVKEVEAKTKVAISEAVDPLKSDVHDLKKRIEALEKPGQLIIGERGSETDNELRGKVEEIEKTIEVMKASRAKQTHTEIVAVVGGLSGLSGLDEAEQWIKSQTAAMKVPAPLDVYIKGEEYKGTVFAKFAGPEAATSAVSAISKKRPQCKGQQVWAKHDQPIHVRAPLSFLFGLKKLLVSPEWEFPKLSIRVNDETASMEYLGKAILKADVSDGGLKLSWLCDEWSQWHELQVDKDFSDLWQKWNGVLKQAHDRQLKGGGKAKGSGKNS